jgi:hypothetical protein
VSEQTTKYKKTTGMVESVLNPTVLEGLTDDQLRAVVIQMYGDCDEKDQREIEKLTDEIFQQQKQADARVKEETITEGSSLQLKSICLKRSSSKKASR